MTLIEAGSDIQEVYTYRIEIDKIFLSQGDSETETRLPFDKLDPLHFNIGYLYP